MNGLLGAGVSTLSGKLAAASGGVALIMMGRWLVKAQIITSAVRMAGFFAILLGVLSLAGVVSLDLSVAAEIARSLGGALPSGAAFP